MNFKCFIAHDWSNWSKPSIRQTEVSLIDKEEDEKEVIILDQVLVQHRKCKRCNSFQLEKIGQVF